MKNKDIKKYIKYLNHQVDIIENDIEESSKHIKLAYMSLKSVKSIINQLSNDVYMDEKHKETTKYVNQYKNRVDVVYETASGKKKELNVPVHLYNKIDEPDVFARVQSIASEASEDKPKDYLYIDSSMEEKAIAMSSL
jgi:hypothetical protein